MSASLTRSARIRSAVEGISVLQILVLIGMTLLVLFGEVLGPKEPQSDPKGQNLRHWHRLPRIPMGFAGGSIRPPGRVRLSA